MHTFHWLLRLLRAYVNWAFAVTAAVGLAAALVVRFLVCGLLATARTSSLPVTGNRPTPSRRRSVSGSDRPNVVPISRLRHTETTSRAIVFGSMDVASLSPSRLDELLVVQIM